MISDVLITKDNRLRNRTVFHAALQLTDRIGVLNWFNIEMPCWSFSVLVYDDKSEYML